MDDQTTPTPINAVTVEPETVEVGTVLTNLESMIKTTITQMDVKKDELRKLNEMTTSYLEQDSTYQEHEKAAKEANRIKNNTKSELLKQSGVAQTILQAKEIKKELKEAQDGLSDYLREYQRMSGSNEIEDDNGEIREIIYLAKLIKRSSKFK